MTDIVEQFMSRLMSNLGGEKDAEITLLRSELEQPKGQVEKQRDLLNDILNINQTFRDTMPKNWEGDELQDACDRARAWLNSVALPSTECQGDQP